MSAAQAREVPRWPRPGTSVSLGVGGSLAAMSQGAFPGPPLPALPDSGARYSRWDTWLSKSAAHACLRESQSAVPWAAAGC